MAHTYRTLMAHTDRALIPHTVLSWYIHYSHGTYIQNSHTTYRTLIPHTELTPHTVLSSAMLEFFHYLKGKVGLSKNAVAYHNLWSNCMSDSDIFIF